MAVGAAPAVINAALDAEITGTIWIQLHVGDPGAAGTANVATNNTRKSCTFGAASAQSKANNSALAWPAVPASETYTHWSAWDASTAGNFKWSGTITNGGVLSGNEFDIAVGGLTATGTGAA